MSLEALMVHTLRVYNREAGSTGRYGDEVPTFDDGIVVKGWVAASAATEQATDRETRLSEYDVALPADTPVDGTSRIEYENRMHEVVGRPRTAHTPRGAHHIELVMRIVED